MRLIVLCLTVIGLVVVSSICLAQTSYHPPKKWMFSAFPAPRVGVQLANSAPGSTHKVWVEIDGPGWKGSGRDRRILGLTLHGRNWRYFHFGHVNLGVYSCRLLLTPKSKKPIVSSCCAFDGRHVPTSLSIDPEEQKKSRRLDGADWRLTLTPEVDLSCSMEKCPVGKYRADFVVGHEKNPAEKLRDGIVFHASSTATNTQPGKWFSVSAYFPSDFGTTASSSNMAMYVEGTIFDGKRTIQPQSSADFMAGPNDSGWAY